MVRKIFLKKGEAYFYAVYYPGEPYHPKIETLIYDGAQEDLGHVFIEAESGHLRVFENNHITNVYDRVHLSEWVLKPADFTQALEEFEYVAL